MSIDEFNVSLNTKKKKEYHIHNHKLQYHGIIFFLSIGGKERRQNAKQIQLRCVAISEDDIIET